MQGKDKDFSKLYHEIVDEGFLEYLSSPAIRVYVVILRHANYKTLLSYPTVKTIIKSSGVNKNRISSATKELDRFGLIKKFRTKKQFNFRNGYQIIKHPKIDLDIIPEKVDKCRRILRDRDKDGKFKPIPKNKDKSIPQNMDDSNPHTKESDICPQKTDKKENLETIIRDNVLDKTTEALASRGSQASAFVENKSIKKVNPDIINGLIKEKGLGWTQKYLQKQGYPEEEIQSLKEITIKNKDVKQDKTD